MYFKALKYVLLISTVGLCLLVVLKMAHPFKEEIEVKVVKFFCETNLRIGTDEVVQCTDTDTNTRGPTMCSAYAPRGLSCVVAAQNFLEDRFTLAFIGVLRGIRGNPQVVYLFTQEVTVNSGE